MVVLLKTAYDPEVDNSRGDRVPFKIVRKDQIAVISAKRGSSISPSVVAVRCCFSSGPEMFNPVFPRSSQEGITGRSPAPKISVETSGVKLHTKK